MTNKCPQGNCLKDFEIIEKIGTGGFAEVSKARCLRPGYEKEYVAIKKIKRSESAKIRCQNEIKIHKSLPSDPLFVKFINTFKEKGHHYLVLELCAGGTLQDYIKKKLLFLSEREREEEAARLIEQVILGVKILHEKNILHRDLSLKNLLLTENYHVKIADFGFATQLNNKDEKAKTVLGTANFMSPEVVNHDFYNHKSDIWSIGCVLYALLYGDPPFNDKEREAIMRGILQKPINFPDHATPEAKKLLTDILIKDPENRIELDSALSYKFFRKYRKSSKGYEYNHKKSSDSGMSSYSNSGSRHKKYDKENKIRKTQDASTSVSRHNSVWNILSESQKHNYSSPISTSCRNSPIVSNQLKAKYETLPSRHESQINTPVKKHPEYHKYPSILEDFAKKGMSSNTYCSDQRSVCNDTHSERKSNNPNMSRQNSCVVTKFREENTAKESSCSHVEYCPPDNNCIHKPSCYCRCRQNSSHHLFQNNSKENRHSTETENTIAETSLSDIVTQLNTSRLSSRRKEFEKNDVVVSILNDGQVCLEFFKLRKGKKLVFRVYFISQDGFQITVYKPKKKIPLNPDKPPDIINDESEYFTFEDIPKIHWKKYQFAKYFVDMVRSITPKVTVHGEHGTCIMMENSPNPNFEMNFYDGFQITESNQKKIIKDKNGLHITKEDENTNFMLTELENMKKQCLKVEDIVETYLNSYFPITCKKKPEVYKRSACQDLGKENIKHSSALSRQASVAKPREVTITIDGNSCENSHPRNVTSIQSNEKNYFSSNERSYVPRFSIQIIKEWIVADYEDGIQMYISCQNNHSLQNTYHFRNTRTQERLSINEYPNLQRRYDADSQNILLQALIEERKRKT